MASTLGIGSKIILGVFVIFLVIILFAPFSQNGIGGFIFLLITGLLALSAAGLISDDVKKLNNSRQSKILSVVLISTNLFFIVWLCYQLGNIGPGDKGIPAAIIGMLFLFMLAVSIIACIVRVIRNEINSSEGHPNKILIPLTFILLIVTFYTPLIFFTANVSSNPLLCKAIFEFKDPSLGSSFGTFSIGAQDQCVFRVAIKTLNTEHCKLLKNSLEGNSSGDPNYCISIVARNSKDPSICSQIDNEKGKADCIDTANFAKNFIN